jgi:hypothetical protein
MKVERNEPSREALGSFLIDGRGGPKLASYCGFAEG